MFWCFSCFGLSGECVCRQVGGRRWFGVFIQAESFSWSHHVVFQSARLSTFEVMAIHLFAAKTLNWDDLMRTFVVTVNTTVVHTFFLFFFLSLFCRHFTIHSPSRSFSHTLSLLFVTISIVHIISIHIVVLFFTRRPWPVAELACSALDFFSFFCFLFFLHSR